MEITVNKHCDSVYCRYVMIINLQLGSVTNS